MLPLSSVSSSELQSEWVAQAKAANKTTINYCWIRQDQTWAFSLALLGWVWWSVGTEFISQQDWVWCQWRSLMRWSRRPLRWDLASLTLPWIAHHLSACSGQQQRKKKYIQEYPWSRIRFTSESYRQVLNALRECPNLSDCSLRVLHLERQDPAQRTTKTTICDRWNQRLHPTNKTCSSRSRSSS